MDAGAHGVTLLAWVQGTGCGSHFGRQDDRITSGLQTLWRMVSSGCTRVLAVEKPGVEHLDQQADAGDVSTCRPEFRVNPPGVSGGPSRHYKGSLGGNTGIG
jgi:hypothetical protein